MRLDTSARDTQNAGAGARRTGLPFIDIQKALWALQTALGLRQTVDCCAICSRLRLVVGRPPSTPFRNDRDARGWPRCFACRKIIRAGEPISRTTAYLVHAACGQSA